MTSNEAGDNKATISQHEDGTNPAVNPTTRPDTIDDDPETRSVDIDTKQANTRYGEIDRELANYVNAERIEISPERSDQLRRMIDKRVLIVMILTYFLQAIDKGTMSFSSIMGLPEDTGLVDAEGKLEQSVRCHSIIPKVAPSPLPLLTPRGGICSTPG